jgi:NADH-quinone oxidoreductase subunit L
MFLMIFTFNTLDFGQIFTTAQSFEVDSLGLTVLTGITIFLFIGCTGKSAQIPLFTWLPDAMAGPTPVSALIHAATMVTAGIYIIARSSILYALSPVTMFVIAIIGIATALFAATIGLLQNDIKKVLAYSTVSQLGYMFLGLGVGSFTGALFHLMTHAFFKALLFLGAGSVIHAMSGEQDIRNMGGLRGKLPITFFTFLIGTIAIAGLPPFSGFFSKDEILAKAYEYNPIFWGLGVFGAALTSFYMFRLLYLTFFGKFRGTHEQAHHLHESPFTITIPLLILAILSISGGFLNVPEVLGGASLLTEYFAPVFQLTNERLAHGHHLSHETEYLLMGVSVGVALLSIILATVVYVFKNKVPNQDSEIKGLANIVYQKYYVDEFYDILFRQPIDFLSAKFYTVVEKAGIDRLVNGFGSTTILGSKVLRLMQTGSIGAYIFIMVIGLILIFAFGIQF